jgi:hypothetical protein
LNEPLPTELKDFISSPPKGELVIENPDVKLSINLYLALEDAGKECYGKVCEAIQQHSPTAPKARRVSLK